MASQEDVISPAISSAMQGAMVKKQLDILNHQAEKAKYEAKEAKGTFDAKNRPQGYDLPTGYKSFQNYWEAQQYLELLGVRSGAMNLRASERRTGYMADLLSPMAYAAREGGMPIMELLQFWLTGGLNPGGMSGGPIGGMTRQMKRLENWMRKDTARKNRNRFGS